MIQCFQYFANAVSKVGISKNCQKVWMRRLMKQSSFVLKDRERVQLEEWKDTTERRGQDKVNTEGKTKRISTKDCVETIYHFSRPTSHICLNIHFSFSEDSTSDTIHITALVR